MANLSKIRRDKMIQFLEALKEQHNDDESLIAINQIEKELASKRYGLVWEEHEENVDVMMQDNIPVFIEVPESEIAESPEENYNFLLEGDNLHCLHLLEKTHRGKVDVIYIDPPYNTGKKDFVYDDKRVESDDSYKHSKWLSFMSVRLKIASRLLSDAGVIFISIDDNEEAQLKLLCDEIFDSNNCLGIIIQNKMNAKNDTTDIQKNHEYILAYRKKAIFADGTKIKSTLIKEEKKLRPVYKDGDRYYYINDAITTRGEGGTLNARPNLGYTVYYNPRTGDKTGIVDYNVDLARTSNSVKELYNHDVTLIKAGYVPILPPAVRGKLGCWTWSVEKFNAQKDNIIITGTPSKYAVKKRTFVSEDSIVENDGKLYYLSTDQGNARSIIDFSTNDGTNVLKEIMGGNILFNNPKNLEMLLYLFALVPDKNSIILDFFAGSGTTAQAVLELNRQDGGNRKFILCTNNENNICEDVTYQRIKTVITGKRKDGTEYSEGIPANLKYYRTDFVSKAKEFLTDALLEHMAEMIQLQHGIKIDNCRYVMLMSDEEADELESRWAEYSDLKAIYVSQNVLLTAMQETLFGTVDVFTIPDCYFNSELREAGELW